MTFRSRLKVLTAKTTYTSIMHAELRLEIVSVLVPIVAQSYIECK